MRGDQRRAKVKSCATENLTWLFCMSSMTELVGVIHAVEIVNFT
jgi:hypothetical protein